MSKTVESFWNERYQQVGVIQPSIQDPLYAAALIHFGSLNGVRLLDLGCGDGRTSLFFASQGAHVVAVDMSQVAINALADFCQEHNIKNIEPTKCSAFEIEQLGKFDYVYGGMILHHLEPFSDFAKMLNQAIKPGGKAFFYENNAGSDLLIWCRNNLIGKFGIPKYGDDEEFPLSPSEVNLLRKYFKVDVTYPKLVFFQLASQYLLKGKLMRPMIWLDQVLFRLSYIRKYSYRQYLFLSK
jgi:SAM-dependent methyltransferase